MDELNHELLRSTGDPPPPQDVSDDLGLLRIDSQHHCPCAACGCTPAIAATTYDCTLTFASPTVQNSAESATTVPEPDPKKPFFGYDLSAFSKIPLPTAKPSPPSLRRCISDPCTPPRAATTGPGSSSLPPKAPVLKRSVSDPTSSPGKNPMRNNDESPTTKRLRRMQDQLKVMNQWVEEIVHEVDDSTSTEEDPESTVKKGEDEAGPSQESVSVDKVGECINIRLNCPCKKVFHVLFFGKAVFYKLV